MVLSSPTNFTQTWPLAFLVFAEPLLLDLDRGGLADELPCGWTELARRRGVRVLHEEVIAGGAFHADAGGIVLVGDRRTLLRSPCDRARSSRARATETLA